MLSSSWAAVPAMCQVSPDVRDGRGCSEAGCIDMAMVHQPQSNRAHSSVSVCKSLQESFFTMLYSNKKFLSNDSAGVVIVS